MPGREGQPLLSPLLALGEKLAGSRRPLWARRSPRGGKRPRSVRGCGEDPWRAAPRLPALPGALPPQLCSRGADSTRRSPGSHQPAHTSEKPQHPPSNLTHGPAPELFHAGLSPTLPRAWVALVTTTQDGAAVVKAGCVLTHQRGRNCKKQQEIPSAGEGAEKLEPCAVLVGLQIGADTVENGAEPPPALNVEPPVTQRPQVQVLTQKSGTPRSVYTLVSAALFARMREKQPKRPLRAKWINSVAQP